MASLDAQIDGLYQLAPSQFTEARNALAKTLGGDEAKRVKRLEKPTVVPWAINQVYWRERSVYERLLKAGHGLRTAQVAALSGKAPRANIQGASQVHRKALADAVRSAVRLASVASVKPDPDALARMFEALSLSPTPPAEPGRMTAITQLTGFEALAGVMPAHVQNSSPSGQKESSKGHSTAARHVDETKRQLAARAEAERSREVEQRRHEEARRKAEAELRKAEHDLERARAAESRARRDLEQAEEAVREAAQRVSTARARLP